MNEANEAPRQRVLHVITHLGLGGAERVAIDLATRLPDHDAAIFAVLGLTGDAVGASFAAELDRANIPYSHGTALGWNTGGALIAGFRLARAIRDFKPTVVHLHTEIPEAAFVLARFFGRRAATTVVVRTIHNTCFWHVWRRIGRACERQLEPSAIACVSDGARIAFEAFQRVAGSRPPLLPPRVIYNGVSSPSANQRDSLAPNRVRMIFAGRLDPQKGADLLPDILRRIELPSGVQAELAIFGSGPCRTTLEALVAHAPAGWTIAVHDPVADLSTRLTQFDLLLMPSRFEGLGLIAVEASQAGLAVIATSAPGLREAFPASHPWLAAAGDAVEFAAVVSRALRERERWPEVAQTARDFAAQRFSSATMYRAYADLYRDATTMRQAADLQA